MGFNYIEEANVTMSDEFHEGVPSMLVASGLMAISEEIDSLDKVKKFMFYGRENEGLNRITEVARVLHPDSCHDIDFASLLPNKSKEDAVRIFHGIIGIITEAGELAEALAQAIVTGEQLDLTNVAEEVGDNQWYAAAILRVLEPRSTMYSAPTSPSCAPASPTSSTRTMRTIATWSVSARFWNART